NDVTPIEVGDVCVNYDTECFAAKKLPVPQTLDDLADPRYRDLLVVQNPATSTPGLAFLLASVSEFGPDGYQAYWQKLKDNGVEVENSWDSAYERRFSGGSGAGNRPLVVSYASSPPAEVVYAEKPVTEAPTGVLLDTCYRQVEFAGLLAGAPNPVGGQELIDFMLTREYQEDLPLNNFVFPVLPDATLPSAFTDNAEVPDKPYSLPPDEVAANRDAWVAGWTDVMER
ncbi:MAG: thiamine ABC transporter substrate-binding protein, partial [Candidatus Nanopelagicales bacterium]